MQTNNKIVNIGEFIKIENSKKNIELLSSLKKQINITIDFFVENNNISSYVELSSKISIPFIYYFRKSAFDNSKNKYFHTFSQNFACLNCVHCTLYK